MGAELVYAHKGALDQKNANKYAICVFRSNWGGYKIDQQDNS